MLGTRILVVLSEFLSEDSLIDTVLDAFAKAAKPFGLRFALPMGFEAVLAQLPDEVTRDVAALASVSFFPDSQTLSGVASLLSDETHFLLLKGPHVFAEKWDRGFLARYRKMPGTQKTLLTAMASGAGEETAPQAFLPALEEEFTENAVKICRGLPLICAAGPVRTLIANPTILFGKVEALRTAEWRSARLSIEAFMAGYALYAVEIPLVWPAFRPGMRWLQKPEPETLSDTQLLRFEQSAGFSFEQRRVGARAIQGLFTTEDDYLQRIPVKLIAEQRARAVLLRTVHRMPLFVTAFYELPGMQRPARFYMLRFAYLKALKNLPLVLYAGGRQERILKKNFPNTFSYPDNALLPRALLQQGMTAKQYFKRNKLPLLQRAKRVHAEFSHYAWVDFDILMHPVPPQAMPDFSHLMDDRIHLAMVAEEPDGSLLIVPRQHMELLVREVYAVSQLDAVMKRGFLEETMLKRLVDKFPDLFALHPVPRRGLLFWTGIDRVFQSEETKELLKDLLPAVMQEPQATEEGWAGADDTDGTGDTE